MSEFAIGWRAVNLTAGALAFRHAQQEAAGCGVRFSPAQLEILKLACLTAAASGMRALAAASNRDELAEEINADTAETNAEGGGR